MTLHQRKRLLQAACAVVATGTALAAILSVALPTEGFGLAKDSVIAKKMTTTQRSAALLPFRSYAVIYRTDLTRPLFDAPPPAPQAGPAAPPPKLNAQLSGTADELGYVCAFFITPQGAIKVVRVGETIDGAEIVEITSGSVRLRQGGQEMTMKIGNQEDP